MIFQSKMLQIAAVASVVVVLVTGAASAQSGPKAPNAPQYQAGTTSIPTSALAPRGTTTGTALNGNTQISVPIPNSNYYGYGQNSSSDPSRGQPASVGGVVGFGRTF